MTNLQNFEDELRATLTEVDAAARTPTGLADRLVGSATRPPRAATTLRPHRRWLPPLLAAAVVLAVVVSVVALVHAAHSDQGRPATGPSHPTSRSVPSPSPTTSAQTTPTPAPTTHMSLPAGVPHGGPVPVGFTATAVSFVNADLGFAIGEGACGSQCARVLRTIDGGRTWAALPVPHGARADFGSSCASDGGNTGPCVDKVTFVNAKRGYVWSFRYFYATTDGGATWARERNHPGHTIQLTIVGDTAVRLRTDANNDSGYGVSHLEAAPAGTLSWHDVTPASVHPYGAGSFLASNDALYFIANTGQHPMLFRSANAGRSWTEATPRPCVGGVANIAAAQDGSVVVGCGGNSSYRLRISTDGGATFGPLLDGPTTTSGRRVSWPDLIAATADQLACISSTHVYASADGGVNWSAVGTISDELNSGFATRSFGYVGTGHGALITEDGGRSWELRTFG